MAREKRIPKPIWHGLSTQERAINLFGLFALLLIFCGMVSLCLPSDQQNKIAGIAQSIDQQKTNLTLIYASENYAAFSFTYAGTPKCSEVRVDTQKQVKSILSDFIRAGVNPFIDRITITVSANGEIQGSATGALRIIQYGMAQYDYNIDEIITTCTEKSSW